MDYSKKSLQQILWNTKQIIIHMAIWIKSFKNHFKIFNQA